MRRLGESDNHKVARLQFSSAADKPCASGDKIDRILDDAVGDGSEVPGRD
jgi:hypothetical protein